ncbi:OmpH family outer membrane protein [Sporomusa sp. KB1]|jgi:outer membrane protein|uniref:OmpH family outer membrane protein n=1 Tax=Sporomusa sp. KB1 TaxID=943346 RepID=UPI0011A39405|nr:OmpH family outer membrane protein [Sporomusa sp. KB1]TWH49252.1 periplasmic chaperone for outer membrane proteins Skp [Sporomusa sp. KB1]
MKKKLIAFICLLLLMSGFASTALAAEQSSLVGFVNVPNVLQNYPGIKDILQKISDEKVRLQNQYNEQAKDMPDSDKNTLSTNLSQEYAKFEQSTMAPVQQQIQNTIAKVAKDNGIKNVVNSNAMLFGGKDLTGEVVKALQK